MKKRTITFLAAVLTITAALFTSCVTQHPNRAYFPVTDMWLVGNVQKWDPKKGIAFKTSDFVKFTLELKVTSEVMENIKSSNNTTAKFKLLTNEKSWGNDWGWKEETAIALDKEIELHKAESYKKDFELPITEGKTYIFTAEVVNQTQMKFSVKEKK